MNTVIRKIGNSEGVILPKELLDQAGWTSGDRIEIVRMGDSLKLVATESAFGRQMRSAHQAMDKYRDALSKLAR